PARPSVVCSHPPPPSVFYSLSLHDALPIFELERLVRHALTGLVLGDDDAVEGLPGLDDLGGLLLDRLEVFGGEGFGDVEVEVVRSEEHTSELQSRFDLVCRLLLEKKNI